MPVGNRMIAIHRPSLDFPRAYLRDLLIRLGKIFFLICFSGAFSLVQAVSCYSVNTPKLVFSPYHPIGSHPEDIETSIDFSCAPAFQGNQLRATVTVQDSGQGPLYQMRNAVGDTLRYGLFIDSARSIPLTSTMALPVRDVNSSTKTFSVILYGRIFANQRTAGVGEYHSFLNLMVSY